MSADADKGRDVAGLAGKLMQIAIGDCMCKNEDRVPTTDGNRFGACDACRKATAILPRLIAWAQELRAEAERAQDAMVLAVKRADGLSDEAARLRERIAELEQELDQRSASYWVLKRSTLAAESALAEARTIIDHVKGHHDFWCGCDRIRSFHARPAAWERELQASAREYILREVGEQTAGLRERAAELQKERDEARKALRAITVTTANGQVCFRTKHDVPMGMMPKLERIARRALAETGEGE